MTIDIFSALVGSPPDLTVINALIQVALFLMESTSSYIQHSRNSFYFALPNASNCSNSLSWPRRDGGKRIAEKNNGHHIHKSASFTIGATDHKKPSNFDE